MNIQNEINCLWIGGKLSLMEKLSIILAQRAGYHVILWSDSSFDDLPNGVELRGIPKDLLKPTQFKGYELSSIPNGGIGSFSHWSDYFAYNILYSNGGHWMQLDLAIVDNIIINNTYAFTGWADNKISPIFMKIPKNSEYAKEVIKALEPLVKNEMKDLDWCSSMLLMHKLALNYNVYNDCKIIDDNDGYIDCGSATKSAYNSLLDRKYSLIHWSNATNNLTKNNPIVNSEYYKLCKMVNLI